MALKVSSRGEIPPFIVMDVMQAATEREEASHSVYHLEVGQPGTPAPAGVLAAAHRALDTQRLGYTVALGVPELRSAIARYYQSYYGVSVDPGRVVVTTGSTGGFVLSFLAAFDAGDRVATVSPGYPCYRHILSAFGIEPVVLQAEAEHRFQPTPQLLEDAMRQGGQLDGLIVASPSNPTGTMLDSVAMRDLRAFCRTNGIRMVSDEIYHGITYGEKARTALGWGDDVVVINSFSKYFSMTGWRLGWMVVPEDLLRPIECLAQNLFVSPPTLSQSAAVGAFDCIEELDLNVARYATNRALLLDQLPKAGFDRLAPVDGAFYIYADVSKLTDDTVSFCRRILNETGVAVTPGVDFDPVRGHRYIRFSFAGSTESISAAASALINWNAR
jgi:aspartate/methionine/tyrosine aminotransferase